MGTLSVPFELLVKAFSQKFATRVDAVIGSVLGMLIFQSSRLVWLFVPPLSALSQLTCFARVQNESLFCN